MKKKTHAKIRLPANRNGRRMTFFDKGYLILNLDRITVFKVPYSPSDRDVLHT